MNLLEKYQNQYEEFSKIDDFNIYEKSKKVPNEKHFWICRLIESEKEKYSLIKQKKKIKDDVIKKILRESPVNLDKKTLDKIDNSTEMDEINEKLIEIDFLIKYLDLVVKSITYIDQSFKNIINIKTLETT